MQERTTSWLQTWAGLWYFWDIHVEGGLQGDVDLQLREEVRIEMQICKSSACG